MSPPRRFIAVLVFLLGGIYLFFEVLADVGGVLWMRHWIEDEELTGVEFRSGRADPFLRDGTVYGVTWNADFLAEPVYRERVIVHRTSDLRWNIKRMRWEFRDRDIDIKFKDEGGMVNVGDAFVAIKKDIGYKAAVLENIEATANRLAEPLRIAKVYGEVDTQNDPPLYTQVGFEGLKLPSLTEGAAEVEIEGVKLGAAYEELEKLGYGNDEIEFNLHYTASYTQGEDIFHIEDSFLEAPGLARISLDVVLVDVARLIKDTSKIRNQEDVDKAKISTSTIEIKDEGLIQKLMEYRAKDKNLSVTEAAADLAGRVPLPDSVKAEIESFLTRPGGRLVIKIDPKSPKKIFELVTELGFAIAGAKIAEFRGMSKEESKLEMVKQIDDTLRRRLRYEITYLEE